MKIVYYTTPDFLDSDISLLREYQRMGHSLMVFVTLAPHCTRGSLVDIKSLLPVDDIIPMADYDEMKILNGYVDLSDFFFVNRAKSSVVRLKYLKTMRKMAKMIRDFNPDVIHSTIPLDTLDNILLKFRKRLVVTFHDPFPHSGKESRRNSFFRWLTLKSAPKIVILNSLQKEKFAADNNIADIRLLVNKLGVYDVLTHFAPSDGSDGSDNILFFGKIASYKGLEYLCRAMTEVNKVYPDLKLTIAGGGKLYFDIEPFKQSANLRVLNRYIPINELANLVNHSEFAVCPYKDATQSGVIMTAFALQCPVLASDVGALATQISDGQTGKLVPRCDEKALADAIINLHADKQRLSQMRANIGRRNNLEANSWHKIAADYIEFYQRPL